MVKKYVVRQAAKDDIKAIGRYTLQEHGKQQRDAYLLGMQEQFTLLSQSPTIGRLRDEIRTGYYSKSYGEHVIFYRINNDLIEIMAVLHKRMLPERHL